MTHSTNDALAPFRLDGLVAVVTGASRGIRAATALTFARAGAHVVLVARDAEALDVVAARVLDDGGRATSVPADLTGPGSAADLVAKVLAEHGHLDTLAAFAGGGGGRPEPLADVDEEHWAATVDTNLTITYRTVRAVLPSMVERRHGSIVTMASSAARGRVRAPTAYAVAKAGIAGLTRQVALEGAGHGIRANCLAPSTILTEKLQQASPEQREAMAQQHPLGRLGTPQDVANAALFLASDASGWVTGVTLDVAGGLVM